MRRPCRSLPRALVAVACALRMSGRAVRVNVLPASDFSAVLRTYCSASLVAEYESLPTEAREGLLSTLRNAVVGIFAAEHPSRESAVHADARCPLVGALARLGHHGLERGWVYTMTERYLPRWGAQETGLELLSRHEAHRRQASIEADEYMHAVLDGEAVVRKSAPGPRDWASLAATSVADLLLFQSASGRVLTGKLVAEPIAIVGVSTILEDQAGGLVRLNLFNCLPGGATGPAAQDLAQRTFPRGTRISIAEPFLKIMLDGTRVVRIDDPSDVRVQVGGRRGKSSDLARARLEAKRLLEEGLFHAAAEEYWRGIRSGATDVAVLLSNRAQASLKRQKWAGALRDAAAAILLDPTWAKSWQRYAAACDGLGSDEVAARARAVRGNRSGSEAPLPSVTSMRELLRKLLLDLVMSRREGPAVNEQPQDLKERGNEAYGQKRYDEAARLYSRALSTTASTGEVAVVLSCLAGCALRTSALHDAVAAAAASLALRPSPNAVFRLAKALALLGELRLAEDVLKAALIVPDAGFRGKSGAKLAALLQQVRHAAAVLEAFKSGSPITDREVAMGRGLVVDWHASDALEVVDMGAKGRGVRAARDIAPWETLIVERSRAAHSEPHQDREVNPSAVFDVDALIHKVKFSSSLTYAVSRDALLASAVARLYDGGDVVPPVVPVEAMLDHFSASVLPLLCQHPDFFAPGERLKLSSRQISSVADVNCHGRRIGPNFDVHLFPAISLLNHEQRPNCDDQLIVESGRPIALVIRANRRIAAGTELTVSYGTDEAAVVGRWQPEEAPAA